MFHIRPIAATAALALAIAAAQPTSARAGDGGAVLAGVAAVFGIAALATMASREQRAYDHYHGPYQGDWYRDRAAYAPPGYAPAYGHGPYPNQAWQGNCTIDRWGRQVCTQVSWQNRGYRRW